MSRTGYDINMEFFQPINNDEGNMLTSKTFEGDILLSNNRVILFRPKQPEEVWISEGWRRGWEIQQNETNWKYVEINCGIFIQIA